MPLLQALLERLSYYCMLIVNLVAGHIVQDADILRSHNLNHDGTTKDSSDLSGETA